MENHLLPAGRDDTALEMIGISSKPSASNGKKNKSRVTSGTKRNRSAVEVPQDEEGFAPVSV